MRFNLYINYYVDSNAERQKELTCCLFKNIQNIQIDRLIIFVSVHHLMHLNIFLQSKSFTTQETNKLKFILKEDRPTYYEYFKLSYQYPDDINAIANTDIVMDANSLHKLKKWHWRNRCIALSRWDYTDKKMNPQLATHFRRKDSQDVWMVYGAFPLIKNANFTLGVAGCDNKIAYLLKDYYHVINPSDDIKTYHYHLTGIKNYQDNNGQVIYRLPPPYYFVRNQLLPM